MLLTLAGEDHTTKLSGLALNSWPPTSSGPLALWQSCYLSLVPQFPTLYMTFIASSVSSNTSSSILAHNEWPCFLFYWENWSNEWRPVATHLAISAPVYSPFPSVTVHEWSGHLSQANPCTCALDPIISLQLRDTPPVIDPFLLCSHQFFPFDHSISR